MIRDNLVLNTEKISLLFGLTSERGYELFELLEQNFIDTLHNQIHSDNGEFNKNIFIANALKLAETDAEEAYCLYHVAQNLESLQRKSELIGKLLS